MSNEYRPGSGRGDRNKNRRRRPRRSGEGIREVSSPKTSVKKENSIVAFFKRLFGLETKAPQTPRENTTLHRERSERPERSERHDRNDRGNRRAPSDRRDREIRSDAESPIEDAGVFKSESVPDQPTSAIAKAAEIEVTNPRLYVGNLSYDAADSDLFDLFSQAGQVRNIEIARERDTHRSKGFGFVEMEDLDSAKAARDRLNGYELMGRPLVVSGAKAATPRGERSERGDRGDRGERRR